MTKGLAATSVPSASVLIRKSPNTLGATRCSSRRHATASSRIVVTGNYRAWRHFVAMRASEHADVEIRELAIAMLRELDRKSVV